MEKYLYLTKAEWVGSWVNGGEIPISLASSYISKERSGTKTPDENLIYDSPVDLTKHKHIRVENGANIKGLTVKDCYVNGTKMQNLININHYHEDGLVLSFCNLFSNEIAHRLGKKACIKILDIHEIKSLIDKQLGQKGEMGECRYTADHQRSHFLKSVEDKWQNEYRVFWKDQRPKSVIIPKGMAEVVEIFSTNN